jgi:hypothetical protein
VDTDQFGVFQDEQRVGSSLVTSSVRQQGLVASARLVASVYKNVPHHAGLSVWGFSEVHASGLLDAPAAL